MELSSQQIERYSRHIMLNQIGLTGQKKLMMSKVLIIGTGGLGSPCAMYLAAAGVGTIGIADADVVDLSNLQRQIIHSTNNLGREKVQSAKETILSINPDVTVKTYNIYVNDVNIAKIIEEYDFIVDCTDNFTSKFLISDACVLAKKPFSHAGINGFQGQLMTYVPRKSPCYRCIFKNPPEEEVNSEEKKIGIVGAMAGVIGSLQAMEAIKYITSVGELLIGCILTYNALDMEFRKVKLPKSIKKCAVCSKVDL